MSSSEIGFSVYFFFLCWVGAGAGWAPPYVSWLILFRLQVIPSEKRRQVVADTRCTDPAADIAASMQNTTCKHMVTVNIMRNGGELVTTYTSPSLL